MRVLCLDIGNTSVAYCEVNQTLFSINRLPNSSDVLGFLKKYNYKNVDQVVVSSVVPSLSADIVNMYIRKGINVFEVSYKNCGLDLKVESPSSVGNDRICNVYAANKIYGNGNGNIIVDFGTATTYDISNNKGAFIGGAIAPGIDISADNLISRTSQLRETLYKFPETSIGKDTTSNIQSGVMYGGLHAVTGMINQIKYESGLTSPNIILTGGFGKLISSKLEIEHIYNESLTIYGMLHIFKERNL